MYIIKVRGPPIKSFLPSSWYQLKFKCFKYYIRFMGRKNGSVVWDWLGFFDSVLSMDLAKRRDQCVPILRAFIKIFYALEHYLKKCRLSHFDFGTNFALRKFSRQRRTNFYRRLSQRGTNFIAVWANGEIKIEHFPDTNFTRDWLSALAASSKPVWARSQVFLSSLLRPSSHSQLVTNYI